MIAFLLLAFVLTFMIGAHTTGSSHAARRSGEYWTLVALGSGLMVCGVAGFIVALFSLLQR
jgi:hypothetical protein